MDLTNILQSLTLSETGSSGNTSSSSETESPRPNSNDSGLSLPLINPPKETWSNGVDFQLGLQGTNQVNDMQEMARRVQSTKALFPEQPVINQPYALAAQQDFMSNGIERELDQFDRRIGAKNSAKSRLTNLLPPGIEPTPEMAQLAFKAFLYDRERQRVAAGLTPISKRRSKINYCRFCKNNGEEEWVYTNHVLKDDEGRITCPILFHYRCPLCLQTGERAHTISHCPFNQGPQAAAAALAAQRRLVALQAAQQAALFPQIF